MKKLKTLHLNTKLTATIMKKKYLKKVNTGKNADQFFDEMANYILSKTGYDYNKLLNHWQGKHGYVMEMAGVCLMLLNGEDLSEYDVTTLRLTGSCPFPDKRRADIWVSYLKCRQQLGHDVDFEIWNQRDMRKQALSAMVVLG